MQLTVAICDDNEEQIAELRRLLRQWAAARALTGMLAPGEVIAFVMYFSKLRSGIGSISGGVGNMTVDMEFMGTAFDFLDLPDQKYKGSIPTEKRDDNEYEFALRHVWFKYPNSDQYVLRDANLTWKVGERMALVGKRRPACTRSSTASWAPGRRCTFPTACPPAVSVMRSWSWRREP